MKNNIRYIGGLSVIGFFILLLMKVWLSEEYQNLLNKMIISTVIVFIGCSLFYDALLYSEKNNNKKEE